MKKCSKCKEPKHDSSFFKTRSECKKCQSLVDAAKYQKKKLQKMIAEQKRQKVLSIANGPWR